MNKRKLIGLASAGIVSLSVVSNLSAAPEPGGVKTPKASTAPQSQSATPSPTAKSRPVCDGSTVTTTCTLDGVNYKKYIAHPAIAEKTHTETVTSYEEKVTGYCTLCVDGTYSPSCATGSGACSHHGGVAEWNAPRYSKVPVVTTKVIVDAPAQAAYTEKIVE